MLFLNITHWAMTCVVVFFFFFGTLKLSLKISCGRFVLAELWQNGQKWQF